MPADQAPVIDDDGFTVAESAAVVLYAAEKAGKLIPVRRARSHARRAVVFRRGGHRWLSDVERRLADRE